jgi:hypothetical protein
MDHLLDEPGMKSRTPGEVLVMDEDWLWGLPAVHSSTTVLSEVARDTEELAARDASP